MIVQANTPTNPDVGQELDPQLINLSGTGHPLTGGIQPQRYQDLRVNGSCAWPTFQHLDMGIESRQVKIADRFPHQPGQVVFGYQVFQPGRYGHNIVAIDLAQPQPLDRRVRRGDCRRVVGCHGFETLEMWLLWVV